MDIWKQSVQKEMSDMKQDIRILQDKQLLTDQSILNIQGALGEIKEDTKWLKRTITNAIIGAVITGIIGGVITLIFVLLQK